MCHGQIASLAVLRTHRKLGCATKLMRAAGSYDLISTDCKKELSCWPPCRMSCSSEIHLPLLAELQGLPPQWLQLDASDKLMPFRGYLCYGGFGKFHVQSIQHRCSPHCRASVARCVWSGMCLVTRAQDQFCCLLALHKNLRLQVSSRIVQASISLRKKTCCGCVEDMANHSSLSGAVVLVM